MRTYIYKAHRSSHNYTFLKQRNSNHRRYSRDIWDISYTPPQDRAGETTPILSLSSKNLDRGSGLVNASASWSRV